MTRPRWTFAIGDRDPSRELTAAKGRKITFRRRGGATFAFTIDGRNEEAAAISELITDVHAWRDETKLFRGRVGPTGDDLDANRHTTSISVGDYRNVFDRRLLFAGDPLLAAPPYAGDAGSIAWQLVSDAQAKTNGDAGVVAGTATPIGLTMASTTFSEGQSITKAIDLFANTDPATTGFEWEIDADLRLNLYPHGAGVGSGRERGRALGVVLDYGGLVAKVKRTLDPSSYANALRVSGDDSIASTTRTAADIATRDEGRWEAQIAHPDAKTVAGLGKLADLDLELAETVLPSYSVTLKPNRWEGPPALWLADVVTLRIRSGRLDVVADYQVEQLEIDVSDLDVETVTVTLGSTFPGFDRRLAAVEDRLRTLERT